MDLVVTDEASIVSAWSTDRPNSSS